MRYFGFIIIIIISLDILAVDAALPIACIYVSSWWIFVVVDRALECCVALQPQINGTLAMPCMQWCMPGLCRVGGLLHIYGFDDI